MIDISIIVVTHNSASVIEGFLSSLRENPPATPFELWVVDNASDDNSVDLIRGSFPDASVTRNASNKGFATGVNQAAHEAGGKFILLANPDVSWDKGAIDRLVSFLESRTRVAAVTPKLVFPDGTAQPQTRRFPTHANIWFSRGTPWGEKWSGPGGAWTYTLQDPATATRVEAASGAFLLIRRDVFNEIGMLDEGYFLYVEDTDICRRFWDAGWEVWIEPQVVVRHRWGGYRKRSSTLRRFHRDGIKRYFKKHHPKKRIRNAILFATLAMVSMLSGPEGKGRSR